MAAFVTIDEKFYAQVLSEFVPNLILDQFAMRRDTITRTERGLAVTFPYVDRTTGSITALPAATGPVTTGTRVASEITLTLAEYGEAPVVFQGIADLTCPYDDMIQAIADEAYRGSSALDTLALKAAVGLSSSTSSAPSASDVAWVHPLGPNTSGSTKYFKPLTDGLIKLGTSTATARSAITSTQVITMDILRERHAMMKGKNVPPALIDSTGNPLYVFMAHPTVFYDLYKETGARALTDMMKYTPEGFQAIKYGSVGVLGGFLCVENSRMFYQSSGASSVNIFPALFMGGDFLGKGFTPAAQLPATDANVQRLALQEAAEVRVAPGYDVHGRLSHVAWYANVVYGIINPYGGFRQEFATANSTFKTATLSR